MPFCVQKRLNSVCYQPIRQLFSLLIRWQEDNLVKFVVQGKMESQRCRGKCPVRWVVRLKKNKRDAGQSNL